MGSFQEPPVYGTGYGTTITTNTSGSAPTITSVNTGQTWNALQVYDIGGHQFTYDIARNQYVSVEKPHIVLTKEMVTNINDGSAVLNWQLEKLTYLDRYKEYDSGTMERGPVDYNFRPPFSVAPGDHWKDNKGRHAYTPNSDWLDAEIDKVCKVGRELLASG